MFSAKVIESDEYLDLSKGAQCLYLHLCMAADDDGMLNSVKKVMRACEATEEEHKELIETGYLVPVVGNIEAIAHWHINNKVPKDRYTQSTVSWKQFLDLEEGVYRPKGKVC